MSAAARWRDYREAQSRWCEWCGETLKRKQWASGRVEAMSSLRKRRFCGVRCALEAGSPEEKRATYVADKEGYLKCAKCGARRPPTSLTQGKCNDWLACNDWAAGGAEEAK